MTGKFYYYAVAYLPAFLASSMAVMIEKPSRRSSLAFYVLNVASEALFRIYVGRGYIRPVPYGQVFLFTGSIATIMYLAKKNGFESDPLSVMISTIVGADEAAMRFKREPKALSTIADVANDDETLRVEKQGVATNERTKLSLTKLISNLRLLFTTRHALCPHQKEPCVEYAARAAARALLFGYCGQFGLRLITRLPAQIYSTQGPLTPASMARLVYSLGTESGVLKFGAFLSAFTGLFKLANCVLRHATDESSARNCFIAGLAAGPTFFMQPSPTMALYVLWKCLEILFHETARQNKRLAKYKNAAIVVLYGLATSQLFYSAVLDPGHIKKSYLAFLDRMSRHRLHWINRNILDVFGTQASLGYEDFFPDLHPKFLSDQFLGSIFLWLIEQRFASSQLSW